MSNINITIPPIKEQEKIVEILELWDKAIETTKKLIEQKKLQKKYLMQKLLTGKIRLKGFKDKWKKKNFVDVLYTINCKNIQIQTKGYLQIGKYPIVDQGKDLISAFSNDKSKLYKDFPVIVFGDHTRIFKYIDFSFVIGADGTQLLKTKDDNLKFIYYILSNMQIQNLGYSRHMTILKEKFLKIPTNIAEQKAIASILSTADNQIILLEQKLSNLELQKKGLMQKLLTGQIRV